MNDLLKMTSSVLSYVYDIKYFGMYFFAVFYISSDFEYFFYPFQYFLKKKLSINNKNYSARTKAKTILIIVHFHKRHNLLYRSYQTAERKHKFLFLRCDKRPDLRNKIRRE